MSSYNQNDEFNQSVNTVNSPNKSAESFNFLDEFISFNYDDNFDLDSLNKESYLTNEFDYGAFKWNSPGHELDSSFNNLISFTPDIGKTTISQVPTCHKRKLDDYKTVATEQKSKKLYQNDESYFWYQNLELFDLIVEPVKFKSLTLPSALNIITSSCKKQIEAWLLGQQYLKSAGLLSCERESILQVFLFYRQLKHTSYLLISIELCKYGYILLGKSCSAQFYQ